MGPFMNALYRRQGNSRSECVWTAVAVCTLAHRFLCLSSHCVPVANIFLVMLFRFCCFLLHSSRYLVIQVNMMRRVNLLKNKLNTQRQLCQCEKKKTNLSHTYVCPRSAEMIFTSLIWMLVKKWDHLIDLKWLAACGFQGGFVCPTLQCENVV